MVSFTDNVPLIKKMSSNKLPAAHCFIILSGSVSNVVVVLYDMGVSVKFGYLIKHASFLALDI